jgi:hypothetical protein
MLNLKDIIIDASGGPGKAGYRNFDDRSSQGKRTLRDLASGSPTSLWTLACYFLQSFELSFMSKLLLSHYLGR